MRRNALDHPGLRLVYVGPSQNLSGLAAVGASVHVNRAPRCTRDTGRELQPPQALTGGRVSEHRVEDACVGDHLRAAYVHGGQRTGQPYSQTPYTAVKHENVRTAAEDGHGYSVLSGPLYGFDQFFGA